MSAADDSEDVGPIGEARVRRMLEDAAPDIERLAPDAAKKGLVLFVTDPRAPVLPGVGSAKTRRNIERLVKHAAGKPLVAALPVSEMHRIFRALADEEPFVGILRRLDGPRGSTVPVVFQLEDLFGMTEVSPSQSLIELPLIPGVDVRELPGEDGYSLSLEGSLKTYFNTPADDVKPEARERHRRFQERVRAALAAELVRAQPRGAGAVLVEAFGGERLRAAVQARGADGLFEAIEATLAGRAS